jgi:hypothetical protein
MKQKFILCRALIGENDGIFWVKNGFLCAARVFTGKLGLAAKEKSREQNDFGTSLPA